MSYRKTESLPLDPYTEPDDIKYAVEMLEEYGVKTEFKEFGTGQNKVKRLILHIPENSRKVGRKKKKINTIPLSKIEDEIKQKSAKEVAAEYGISRATLFRKIKEAKENGYECIF